VYLSLFPGFFIGANNEGKTMKEQKIFKTSVIGFSAILKLHNIPLLKIETNGHRAFFCYERCGDINGLSMNYCNRRLKIELKSLLDSIRMLKAAAATALNNEEGRRRGE
jgi:hypothetical protein